jgi:hypothetical protein
MCGTSHSRWNTPAKSKTAEAKEKIDMLDAKEIGGKGRSGGY